MDDIGPRANRHAHSTNMFLVILMLQTMHRYLDGPVPIACFPCMCR